MAEKQSLSQNKKDFMNRIKNMAEKGFTIVELMIALSILSALLLLATLVMAQIGRLYTKGVNQASLQNTTRNISDDISSAIEFSGFAPTTGSFNGYRSICIGNVRYSYQLNRKLGTDNSVTPAVLTRHVLWRDVMSSSTGNCVPLNLGAVTPGVMAGSGALSSVSGSGYEMMPENTRLVTMGYEQPVCGGVYKIRVYSAYGDSDLVGTKSVADKDCNGQSITVNEPFCQTIAGSQFCAISVLTTSVSRRLE